MDIDDVDMEVADGANDPPYPNWWWRWSQWCQSWWRASGAKMQGEGEVNDAKVDGDLELNVGVWEVHYENIYGDPLKPKCWSLRSWLWRHLWRAPRAKSWHRRGQLFHIDSKPLKQKCWCIWNQWCQSVNKCRYVPMFCKMSDYQSKMIELWFIMIWTNRGIEFCMFCTTCLSVCECVGVECIKVVNRNGEGQVRSSSWWTTGGQDQIWRLWPRDQEPGDKASERPIWVLVIEWQH